MTDETPAFVDSSVIVRYLIQDVPELYEQAIRIIEQHPSLLITPGTLFESAFVLTRFYGVSREAVVDTLIALLRRTNIHVHQLDKMLAIQALLFCRPSGRVSFADAILWAEARSAGPDATIFTFDKRFLNVGIQTRDMF